MVGMDHGWLSAGVGGVPVARDVDATPELRNTVAFSTTGIHLFRNAEPAVKMMRDDAEADVFTRVEKSVSAVGPASKRFSVNMFFRVMRDEVVA